MQLAGPGQERVFVTVRFRHARVSATGVDVSATRVAERSGCLRWRGMSTPARNEDFSNAGFRENGSACAAHAGGRLKRCSEK